MPATVVASKGMKLIDHDGLYVLKQLSMIDLGGDQHRFQRFRRGEQAFRRVCEDSVALPLRGVAVPASGSPSDKREVVSESRLLVIEQCSNRADVEDREA